MGRYNTLLYQELHQPSPCLCPAPACRRAGKPMPVFGSCSCQREWVNELAAQFSKANKTWTAQQWGWCVQGELRLTGIKTCVPKEDWDWPLHPPPHPIPPYLDLFTTHDIEKIHRTFRKGFLCMTPTRQAWCLLQLRGGCIPLQWSCHVYPTSSHIMECTEFLYIVAALIAESSAAYLKQEWGERGKIIRPEDPGSMHRLPFFIWTPYRGYLTKQGCCPCSTSPL